MESLQEDSTCCPISTGDDLALGRTEFNFSSLIALPLCESFFRILVVAQWNVTELKEKRSI
jgi:hypothetical protein